MWCNAAPLSRPTAEKVGEAVAVEVPVMVDEGAMNGDADEGVEVYPSSIGGFGCVYALPPRRRELILPDGGSAGLE